MSEYGPAMLIDFWVGRRVGWGCAAAPDDYTHSAARRAQASTIVSEREVTIMTSISGRGWARAGQRRRRAAQVRRDHAVRDDRLMSLNGGAR